MSSQVIILFVLPLGSKGNIESSNNHGYFSFNAQVEKNRCCLLIAYTFDTLVVLNSSRSMTAKGRLFEYFLHPRTVEEIVVQQGSTPDRRIRMFEVQVISFHDSATSNSQARYY